MKDIQQTKQALVALVKAGKAFADLAKDGLDLSDAVALGTKLVSDEKFRNILIEGVKGAGEIPEEIKDIAASEAIELLGAVYEALKA